MISERQAEYLEILRKAPANPIGWLYRGVFAEMATVGLCVEKHDGFHITVHGIQSLAEFNASYERARKHT